MTAPGASLNGSRIAGALALASAGITLGAGAHALAFMRRLGPYPEDPLDAAGYNRRQAPFQMRLHLLIALTHPLMAPAAIRLVPGLPAKSTYARVGGAAAEALMLASMLAQARAWKRLSSLYDSAASDEERVRTLGYMEGPNKMWAETAGVALWAVLAAAAAVRLRRSEPRRAGLSAGAALVWIALLLRPSEPGRALSFAARIMLCGLNGASLLSAEPLSPANESASW